MANEGSLSGDSVNKWWAKDFLAMNLLQDLCRAVASARVVPRRQPGLGGWVVWFVGEGNEVAVK